MASKKPVQSNAWRIKPSERRFLLFLVDLIVTVASLVLAMYIWSRADPRFTFNWEFVLTQPPTWYFFLPVLWLLLLSELYDNRRSNRLPEVLKGIGMAVAVSAIIYLGIFFLSKPNSLPRLGVAFFFLFAAFFTLSWRLIYIRIFTAPSFMRRMLVVGAGRAGSELVTIIKGLWPQPFYLVGYIDDDENKQGSEVAGLTVLGGGKDLLQLIDEYHVSDIIFAISGEMQDDTFKALLTAEENGVEITTMPVVYEQLLGRVPIFLLPSDWVLRSFVDAAHSAGAYELGKRLLDLLGSLVGLLILAFFMPMISLAILLDSGGPVLYSQIRMGKNNRPYNIIKFRTMRKDAESDGVARPAAENDQRVTRVGRILRKSHLDELPQFINVLKGEMSLVGPRPERPELIEKLQTKVPFYRARQFVKPGVTGWAQVNFHYASTVEDTAVKLEYDLYYIKHRNLLLDITILIRTVGAAIGLRGL